MTYIARSVAHDQLLPYFADFSAIVESAWSDWMNAPVASQMQHKRVRANYVWNQLLTHARRRFDGHPEVSVHTLRHWDGLLINNSIFIRMKKGDSSLLSRNYPTQSALNFNDPIHDLFGGIARLELLYILDETEVEVERIAIVQRKGGSVSWSLDVVTAEPKTSNIEIFSHESIDDFPGSAADRVIKRKSDTQKKKDGTKNGAA